MLGARRYTPETEGVGKESGEEENVHEVDDEEEENRRKSRKGENEEREWRIKIERKLDEAENVGRFMMVNLGSLLRAVEGLKQEVKDKNTEMDESEREAEDVAEGMEMEE